MANNDSLPTITSAYVNRYGTVVVKVEPYIVHDGTRNVEVSMWVGEAGDRGSYLVGRGYMVRKDGTVGVRRIDIASNRTPRNVSAAARAAIAEAGAR